MGQGSCRSSRKFRIDPPQQPVEAEPAYDVVKVCQAIACSETSCGKDGTARSRNNHHGIMKFWIENGERKRTAKYYKRPEESYRDCERIWNTYYKRLPDLELAIRWTGNDNAETWLSNFWITYNSL